MPEVLSGIAIGALSGALTGFVASVAVLAARRARNAWLVARGEPPYRDVLLPPFHFMGAIAGAVLGGVARLVAPGSIDAPIVAGSVVPALLALVSAGAVIAQLRRR